MIFERGRGLELDETSLGGELGMMAASGAAGPGFKSRRPHQTNFINISDLMLMPCDRISNRSASK